LVLTQKLRRIRNVAPLLELVTGWPEVINGEYSKEIDIWSLGITIFEMSTGSPPLTNLNPTEVGFWIASHDPPKIPKDWDSDLQDFVSKMLIFEPEKRGTIKELLIHPFLKNRFE
jgi:serine/threonine protein kinase